MNRPVSFVVLVGIACTFLGCAPSDPVENLKWHFEKSINEYNAKAKSSGGIEIDRSKIRVNVRKSDNLVTPFLADIEIVLNNEKHRAHYEYREKAWERSGVVLRFDESLYNHAKKDFQKLDMREELAALDSDDCSLVWRPRQPIPEVFELPKNK